MAEQLNKLDQFGKVGAWTTRVMFTIEKNPEVRAVYLAEELGLEKSWLKLNIRKLKNLGLTISHETGYSLSPLGQTFLNEQKIRSNS
jgi:biotin operon repressor